MPDYTNESTLVLFKNDKGDNPKRPDYRGKLYLHGEEYKISAWVQEKKDGSGEKYMKGRIERAAPIPPPQTTAPASPSQKDNPPEDVPF